MNSIVTLASLFGLMTLLSASVLYFSFKGKMDGSGKYFLAAELLMLFALSQVITTNLAPATRQPIVFLLGTILITASDISVLFSIFSLTRTVKFRTYIFTVLMVVIYCMLIEYARIKIDSNLPALLTAIPSALIALVTYMVCTKPLDHELKSNIFLKWITYTEVILLLLALTRIASYFYGAPILPRNPPAPAILIYVLFTATCIFRYISYQSLRISWINADADRINPLNQNLAKAIQEKNKLLEGLISSNRKIGISALASSLAHQLSQPITGLSFQIHTAKYDLLKLQEAQNSVRILDKASLELEKLTDLVNGLRRLFGRQETEFEKINVVDTCNKVIELIKPTLEANGISLATNFESRPIIIGNMIQLQQVLINIFNNAIYSIGTTKHEYKKIVIEVSEGSKLASISIGDSGPGIDPNILPDIFELYKTTKKEGLGVGLWLSKTIIERHKGCIKVANDKNLGAIFNIEIPLAGHDEIQGNK
ncbi:sensor histidine kinase [Polynucleobacter sp. AP-RePozz3-80-G7]|uniref:sensor histidine kinase n=1 Tax=Polynucleobacter sp. AP-RePozz3-80-G7 TaxID=2689105 RepID=UPI001C0D1448|nr:HAMP domain-containing sensor histidine kinase [Polynucleobacter sp. AP-RePozz3-80-G7]MBU3638747.1 HAMP domain-containing histidine kinase [Polynucleobacter sp. AP-RePozz3-80-G7]